MSYKMPVPPSSIDKSTHAYLYQLVEALNVALDGVDAATQSTVQTTEAQAGTQEQTLENMDSLKSLIVSTANTVNSELATAKADITANSNGIASQNDRILAHDSLIQSIQSDYTAKSDFGTLSDKLTNYISANDAAVTQANTYTETVETGLNSYETYTNGFIRSGFIGVDESNVPIEGIMIAQQLTTKEVTATVGGVQKTVTVIVGPEFYSTFTATKLSFWQGGTEVAYVSNQKLYITDASFSGSLNMNGKWSVSAVCGFTIKWIGA